MTARKKKPKAKGSTYDDTPWFDDPGGKTSSSNSWNALRCYDSHPPYEVAPGIVIYGGSCLSPIVKDADVYVGLQSGMKLFGGKYPWSKKQGPVEFQFTITDMQAPSDPVEFKNLIEYLAEQLTAGKKVHVGCIGGHGRTGTVFAALRKHMADDEDATAHVRQNYCKKVVESSSQIEFLHKHWGIKKVAPTKGGGHSYGTSTKTSISSGAGKTQRVKGKDGSFDFTEYDPDKITGFDLEKKQKYHQYGETKPRSTSTGKPLETASSIWG